MALTLITHHMGLLSKSSVAHLADKRFLSSVDFKMLLEIESLRVYQESTDWTALVVRPEMRSDLMTRTCVTVLLTSDRSCGC